MQSGRPGDDVPKTPLIPVSLYDAVQREVARRKTRWRKTKLAEPRHSLAVGLLSCGCNLEHPKAMYIRDASKKDQTRRHDYFYCSMGFKERGPKCDAARFRCKRWTPPWSR